MLVNMCVAVPEVVPNYHSVIECVVSSVATVTSTEYRACPKRSAVFNR
jgi:hypothetical protein